MDDFMKEIENFTNYVNGFDQSNKFIKLKYNHSLRVMELCGNIASSLNVTDDKKRIMKLIGLLHDFGRFKQIEQIGGMSDMILDHSAVGLELLFDRGMIKNYVPDEKNYELIKNTIFAHNKYDIPEYYDAETKFYSEILRDADKLDILWLFSNGESLDKIDTTEVTKKVYQDFKDEVAIHNEFVKTSLDKLLQTVGLVYDLNFKYSFCYLTDNEIIDKIVDRYGTNEIIKNFLEDVKIDLKAYIKKKMGDIAM